MRNLHHPSPDNLPAIFFNNIVLPFPSFSPPRSLDRGHAGRRERNSELSGIYVESHGVFLPPVQLRQMVVGSPEVHEQVVDAVCQAPSSRTISGAQLGTGHPSQQEINRKRYHEIRRVTFAGMKSENGCFCHGHYVTISHCRSIGPSVGHT